ncbi:hypothetical protein [Parasphingorhabdus sp.]|uniref:hypothetical protein n=1 Tax=Parasphingorhabdus sp. TaxID=2709688 RepID=UPI0030028F75
MRKSTVIISALIGLGMATPAHAKAKLVSEWFENGSQMCKYDDGTILNVGGGRCPTSIG